MIVVLGRGETPQRSSHRCLRRQIARLLAPTLLIGTVTMLSVANASPASATAILPDSGCNAHTLPKTTMAQPGVFRYRSG